SRRNSTSPRIGLTPVDRRSHASGGGNDGPRELGEVCCGVAPVGEERHLEQHAAVRAEHRRSDRVELSVRGYVVANREVVGIVGQGELDDAALAFLGYFASCIQLEELLHMLHAQSERVASAPGGAKGAAVVVALDVGELVAEAAEPRLDLLLTRPREQ